MSRVRSRLQLAYARRNQDIGKKVAVGAGLQFLGIALRTVITIGSTAVLARLLSPSDFGLVAMATVVTELAGLLGAFGLSNVLVQRRVINRLQLDTVFWASLGLGGVLALVVLLLSFATEWMFSNSDVGRLLRFMCLNFVLNGFVAVPWAVLARLMRYQTDFLIQLTVVVVRTAAAIFSAWLGMGMWSLVVGALVGSSVYVVLGLRAARYWPRLRFHWPVLANSWRTSGSYLGNSVLYYINMNLDLWLIGRQLGATSLGYYQSARSLTDEIRGRIAMPIQQVLFPAFSSLQTDQARFQQLVMRAGRLLSAVVIPIGFGVSANAEELVLVLYGSDWQPMTSVIKMFGLSAAIRASTAIGSPLFNANDRTDLLFRFNAVGTALTVLGVVVAIPFGLHAVAVVIAISSLYSLVALYRAFALIGLNVNSIVKMLGPPLVASLLMWFGIEQFRGLGWPLSSARQLVLNIFLGAGTYLTVLLLISRQYLQDGLDIVTLVRSAPKQKS